jgi:hypothetical protein
LLIGFHATAEVASRARTRRVNSLIGKRILEVSAGGASWEKRKAGWEEINQCSGCIWSLLGSWCSYLGFAIVRRQRNGTAKDECRCWCDYKSLDIVVGIRERQRIVRACRRSKACPQTNMACDKHMRERMSISHNSLMMLSSIADWSIPKITEARCFDFMLCNPTAWQACRIISSLLCLPFFPRSRSSRSSVTHSFASASFSYVECEVYLVKLT